MKLSPRRQGILICLAFTLIYLYSFIPNIDKAVALSHGDTFHVLLTVKHYMDVIFTWNWQDLVNVPMFYGYKDVLLFSEPFIMEAVFTLPFYALSHNIVLSLNIVSVLTIFLSLYSMYLLTYYLTGKILPSVLASVIYVLNPFVIGHFPDNLHYFSLEWIPLIILFLEKSLKDPKKWHLFWVFILLTGQLLTSLTYGALLTVVLPIYVAIRLVQERLKPWKLINWQSIMGFIIFGTVAGGLGVVYSRFYSSVQYDAAATYSTMFSPWVSDLFFAHPTNLIYGGLRQWTLNNFPNLVFNDLEDVERNLFWGITPIILFITSFWLVRKSQFRKYWLVGLMLISVCTLLSFGPQIRFSADLAIPGIYGIISKIDPLFHNIRVASRFYVFVPLFLGLIGSFTVAEIEPRLRGKLKLMPVLIIALVLIEYWSLPYQFYQPNSETVSFYRALDKQPDIQVVVEMPMGNLFSPITYATNQMIETEYMFYSAALHHKELLNGYSSYIPDSYGKKVTYLSVNFPNPVKLKLLKDWGVQGIVLHKQNFSSQSDYTQIRTGLTQLGVPLDLETPDLQLFDLTKWKPAQ